MVEPQDKHWWKNATSIYEFSATDIDGSEVSLEKYRGHVCIIINVACKTATTQKDYEELQSMYEEFGSTKGLRILAFPCNQFGIQSDSNEEVKKNVNETFGITFDMFAKIDVNTDSAHPLWKYLKHKQGGTLGDFIKWNFTKFLINKEGQPVHRYSPNDEPFSLKKDLEKYW